jgi:tetratricopeptide (TPR) repeat protein
MIVTTVRHRIAIVALALLVLTIAPTAPVLAFSSGSGDEATNDPDMRKGDAAVIEKRYEEALVSYNRVLDRDPENADAWSQIGSVNRKLGNFEQSLESYQHALEIEPFHLGANEYLGELYLQTDQVDKAEEMAEILRRACVDGCDELTELTGAIEAYRKSSGKVKWNK